MSQCFCHAKLSQPYVISDEDNRRFVADSALYKTIKPLLVPEVELVVKAEYEMLKRSPYFIDQQTYEITGTCNECHLTYANINENDKKTLPQFDYRVRSHVDLAKVFLPAEKSSRVFSFEECDLLNLLKLLCAVPRFSVEMQRAAANVKRVRNRCAHYMIMQWTAADLEHYFTAIKQLVRSFHFADKKERQLMNELDAWKTKEVTMVERHDSAPMSRKRRLDTVEGGKLSKQLCEDRSVPARETLDVIEMVENFLNSLSLDSDQKQKALHYIGKNETITRFCSQPDNCFLLCSFIKKNSRQICENLFFTPAEHFLKRVGLHLLDYQKHCRAVGRQDDDLSKFVVNQNDQIDYRGIAFLLMAEVEPEHQIKDLSISLSEHTDQFRYILEALQSKHCHVTTLEITGGGDEEIDHLSQKLSSFGCPLEVLILHHCQISNNTVKHVAEVLSDPNCPLEKVKFFSNFISDEAADRLTTHVKTLQSLKQSGDASKLWEAWNVSKMKKKSTKSVDVSSYVQN